MALPRLRKSLSLSKRVRLFAEFQAYENQAYLEIGFNMESNLARTTTYAAHLLDGNPLTDLISIGKKTPKTGPDPPAPAIVGGLSNHGTFEGDASLTRADAYWGEDHAFNQTLFEEVSVCLA